MKKLLLFSLLVFSFSFTYAQIITAVAGNAIAGFSGDGGLATAAKLNNPIGVAFDSAGNMYIADNGNFRIRKVNTTGYITTFAGTGVQGYFGDGGQATLAMFMSVSQVACDAKGNVYVVDYSDNRVRKIDTSGIITTIAGNGTTTYTTDGVAATQAGISPSGVAIDTAGAIFISDSRGQALRKVDKMGYISTIAGTGVAGYTGDGGPSIYAQVDEPGGIYCTPIGVIYFADSFNNAIRKIDRFGNISTIAGTSYAGYNGEHMAATLAELFLPGDVVQDSLGNVYISDQGNGRVRIINPTGYISTAAGDGGYGLAGDGGVSYLAELASPHGIAVNKQQNLFIADFNNNLIRMVSKATFTGVNNIAAANNAVGVYPNPSNGTFTIKSSVISGQLSGVEVYNMLGEKVYANYQITKSSNYQIDLSNQPNGVYLYRILSETGTLVGEGKLVIEK